MLIFTVVMLYINFATSFKLFCLLILYRMTMYRSHNILWCFGFILISYWYLCVLCFHCIAIVFVGHAFIVCLMSYLLNPSSRVGALPLVPIRGSLSLSSSKGLIFLYSFFRCHLCLNHGGRCE